MSGYWPNIDQVDSRFAGLASGPPAGFAENFEAQNRDMLLFNRSVSRHNLLSDAYEKRIADLKLKTGQQLRNPVAAAEEEMIASWTNPQRAAVRMALSADGILEKHINEFEKSVDPWRQKHPELKTRGQMMRDLADIAGPVEQEAQQVNERATFAGKVGGFLGMMAGAMQDPVNLLLMPFGAGATAGVLRTAITEAAIGAGSEAVIQTEVQPFRGELGLEHGLENALENVAAASGGAAVFGAVVKGVPKLVDAKVPANVRRFITNIQALAGDKLVKLFDATIPAPTREQKLARDLQGHINDVNGLSPLDMARPGAAAEHNARLTEAMRALQADRPAEMAGNAAAPVTAEAVAPRPMTGLIEAFDPATIRTDAKTFQFKEGGDSSGVTDRLEGVKAWDETKAGMVIVFENTAGERFIADGHQRLGLARRLQAADPSKPVTLYGPLLREADGYTPEAVRVIAAMKNIAEGTGSAVDAAKVLRVAPARLSELPPRSQLVRQAADMVKLSDEAFGFVVNEIVPANFAAIVGRLVDEKLQLPIINLLAKLEPENAAQAEAIVRQAMEAGTKTETQISLFGEEHVTSSLYLERAKVLDKALKKLRQDNRVFRTLVDNAAQLAEAGNVLKTEVNAATAETAARAQQMIQTLANRKGALSDALTAAAGRAANEGKYAGAAADFADAVRSAIERGDFNGLDAGGDGRHAQPEAENGPRPAEAAEPDHLEKFDQPNGQGAQEQTRALEADVLRAAEPAPEGAAPQASFLDEHIPVSERVDENGNVVSETRSVRDLLADLDQDAKDLEAISKCGVP